MKTNSKHYILIFFATATFLVSGFGYWYVYDTVLKQKENYLKVSKEVETERGKQQYENELMQVYKDTAIDRAKLPNFFVSESKVLNFIKTIESIGPSSKTEIRISSIVKDALKVRTHIDIKGGWINVMLALTLIENLPYSISLENVSLFNRDKKWEMTFDLSVLTTK